MAQQADLTDVLGIILYDAIRLNHNHATLTQLLHTINDKILPYGNTRGPVELTDIRTALTTWEHLYPQHQPRRYTTSQNTRSTLLEVLIAKQVFEHIPEPLLTNDLITMMTVLHPTMPKIGAAQLIENLRHHTDFKYHTRERRIGLASQPPSTRLTRLHWWLVDTLNRQPNQSMQHLLREISTRAGRAQHPTRPSLEELYAILESHPRTFVETKEGTWRTVWMDPTPTPHRLTPTPANTHREQSNQGSSSPAN